jgi:hypothetical protein
MQAKPVVSTSVSQVEEDINDILFPGGAGAGSVITPKTPTEVQKPNMFSRSVQDLSFLEETAAEEVVDEEVEENDPRGTSTSTTDDKNKNKPNTGATETIDDVIGQPGESEEETTDSTQAKSGGRVKTDKSGLVDLFKREIEAGTMVTFDDFDETKQTLDEYLGGLTQKDLDELWGANKEFQQSQRRDEISQQLFESLPTELQYAYKYVTDGGKDMKSLFRALSEVEQNRELNPENEDDHERIVRSYLSATQFGNDDEIDEEIKTWGDLGVLDKKAKQFKPKLDKMAEQQVAAKLKQQEEHRAKQEAAAEAYVNNVYKALEPGELNGVKLDKKQQAFLYNSLVKAQYQSVTGQPTNLLGHLLEKYQYVEPNYSLIAEATWLLSDPETYRASMSQNKVNKNVEQTVRKLKTEQARKSGGVSDDQEQSSGKQGKISRPSANIFRR